MTASALLLSYADQASVFSEINTDSPYLFSLKVLPMESSSDSQN